MAEPAATLVELNLLKPIDTLHDFWSNQRGDDIRDILNAVTYNTDQKFKTIIDNIAKEGIKINDIENTGAAYFEKKNNLPSIVDDNIITIDATNTADNNANNLVNYLNNEAVQIILPHDIDEEYDLGYLATFIRQFMFGGEGDNIGFVIDANHGKLPQIFKTDTRVKTVLNALVVGDSANTPKEHSNSRFYERLTPNKFPFYNPLPREVTNNTGNLYEVDQSPFFSSLINFYYQETSPGSFADNITAFKLVVENKDKTTQYGEAYFSPTTTQGASVDTLKKLIQIVENNENNNVFASELANMEYPAKQLDIRSIVRNMRISLFPKNEIVNFLLDYKRAGDYEQINSALVIAEKREEKIIFSTGDQLCALYARSQRLPCIYNHAGKMDLYTFAEVKDSLEQKIAKQIKKYEAKKAYYEKYKNFFNIIPPETLAALIQDYLNDIDAYVRTQIKNTEAAYFINRTMHAYKTVLGYTDEPPSAVLNGIMASLTKIIEELDEKIKDPSIVSNDETREIAKKIQQFLDIVDKIVENIADITLEEIQKKMTEQTRKIYEIDNNFFNHRFDSHKLFASFYENFQADAKEEKKVTGAQKYKEDAETTLTKYISEKNRKIPDQEKRVNGAILALYAAKNKYESKIMAQIKSMNDEIEKIYQNYDELMPVLPEEERFTAKFKVELNKFNKEIEADKGDKFDASVIIAKYKEFIARITTPGAAAQSAAANAPDEDGDVFYSQGGGNLGEEEEIKIITGLETALLTLGDYCATMFTALHKEYEYNKKGKVKQIEFKTYLKHVYEELYALEQKAKKRDIELSKILNNKIQFNIDGELYDTIRTDYVKYINTLISEFNGTIIENMPPTLKPDEYNAKIKEILRGSGNSQFIVLLYESAEAEGGAKRKIDDVTEEESEADEIDLHALFYLTCKNKDGKIIEIFKNFDEYKINPSSFSGGGTSFRQASKKIKLMKSVVEAFKTFKQIKEEKIKEREIKNEQTQDKWASIKRIASPMILVKEPSAVAATKRLRTLSPSPVPGEEPIKTKRGKQTPSPAPAHVKSRRRITYGPGWPTPGPTPSPSPAPIEIGRRSVVKRKLSKLPSLEEEGAVVGGKKRTRKYKNRENKKTIRPRHRNKNQKNKTQKNKRKGRKHKTRRQ